MNDELNDRLSKAKEDAVAEFKSSKAYTDTLDRNYAAGFEDFIMDAIENFPEVALAQSSLTLLLPQALFSRPALMTSMWKTTPVLSLPRTSLM